MSKNVIDEILRQFGKAGTRLDEMHAVEAGAGNLSICVAEELDLGSVFDVKESNVELPVECPSLAGKTVFVTGSGCRLRELSEAPQTRVSAFLINEDGKSSTWFYSKERLFEKPTSEFNSHLAVHNSQMGAKGTDVHAVVHAQPPHIVALSHIDELRNNRDFNRAIIRWEPESIVQLSAGVEVLDYMVPGSATLMENTVRALKQKRIAIWSRHGLMARSDISLMDAIDKIEYAETGAMYEVMNRSMGEPSSGLSEEDLKAVVNAFGIDTDLV